MDNKRLARELVRIAKEIVGAYRYDKKIIGNGCRIEWNNFNLLITELPEKGKKKLRIFRLSIWDGIVYKNSEAGDDLIMQKLLKDAHIGKSSTYDQAKQGIIKVVREVLDKWSKEGEKIDKWVFMNEDQVHYLKVEPEDVPPIIVKDKNFLLESTWTSFNIRFSDGDPYEPSASYFSSSSSSAARKFYKMLRANPKLIKDIQNNSFSDITDFFRKNKIGYKTHLSQWR